MSPWALRLLPGHLLVLALLGAALWLGSWQYGAGQGEREATARDLTRSDPVPLADVLGPDDAFPAPSVGQPVSVSGEWVPDATVFVERDGGYWVVTPLAVGGADAPALPVVRGVSDEPAADPVTGPAELTGWLQPAEGTGAVTPTPPTTCCRSCGSPTSCSGSTRTSTAPTPWRPSRPPG